ESVHTVPKKELVYRHKVTTRKEAKEKIFEYITCFYNGKRIHSSIGYLTPNQCEHMICLAA
ncbi:IS3 family transposase, partial [Paenibacillus larvae]|uniref:IS3 family transposase n=1 Tax=Paenibacillus larvae TaxID=1464 RepID=UPI0022826887